MPRLVLGELGGFRLDFSEQVHQVLPEEEVEVDPPASERGATWDRREKRESFACSER